MRAYTTSDGLPSTFIEHVVQDSRGFLWFSTRDGLSRFDGYRFVAYGTSHGLPVPTINFLLERRDGSYWIATNGGGACRFNPSATSLRSELRVPGNRGNILSPAARNGYGESLFACRALGEHSGSQRVNRLYEDRRSTLWAATDHGLFRLARERDSAFQRVDLDFGSGRDRLPAVHGLQAINPLLEDREGSLWIGTNWGLVRRLPDGRMVHLSVHPKRDLDGVNSLVEDSNGRLWIGHAAGLFIFRPESARDIDSLRRPHTTTLAERARTMPLGGLDDLPARAGDVVWYGGNELLPSVVYRSRSGSIWCGIAGRFLRFNDRTHATIDIGEWDQTPFTSLAEDLHGNLWIAGRTGALKLLLNGFSTFGERDGLPSDHVHSIFEDPLGHVTVVTGRWRIHRFDGARFHSSRLAIPRDMVATWGSQVVFVDSASRWWGLTATGLFRFPPSGRRERLSAEAPVQRYTSRDGLPGDGIIRLFEDARGDIWIGARSGSRGGLSKWDRTTGQIDRPMNSAVTRGAPTAFAEDRSGGLWIGFYDGGLARLRDDRASLVGEEAGVPAGMITALHIDAANRLWIATNRSGVARADDPSAPRPQFVRYTTTNGLSSDNVRCITEDRQGRLYFGTVRGVDRLEVTTGRVRQYTAADGLNNGFVTAAFRDRQGILWFGTANGVSRLVPRLDPPGQPPPVLISGLRIAGVQQPISELGETSIDLPELTSDRSRIQFDFHGLGFAMGERLRYRYKLEGVDADWSAVTDERSVTYASLAPRSYRFVVQALNAEAVASAQPAVVTFTILAPFWQRGWFVTMSAAGAALLIALVYRARVGHLLALERVRMDIATDLHDDLGSNLTQIAILSEVARRQIGFDGSPATRSLDLIANVARSAIDSMSDIVWATNPEKDSAWSLVTRMRNLANEVLATSNVDFSFEVTGDRHARLDAQLRRQVFLVFKESLNNVVRHSGSRRVAITLHANRRELVLWVADQGKGFDASAMTDRHGLASMHRRASSIGGRLELTTAPGRGTSLTLNVPRRHAGKLAGHGPDASA